MPEAAPKNQHNMEERRKEGVLVGLDQAPKKGQVFGSCKNIFKKCNKVQKWAKKLSGMKAELEPALSLTITK